MVALYAALIINGRRTFDQVPAKFKEAVRADLEALSLDENGDPVA
ncbi:CD1375 family protein [Acutalibacter sp. 1XD8-33]|nr:CD1375 family protein [Acutalibacter sp. 1XD8-33]